MEVMSLLVFLVAGKAEEDLRPVKGATMLATLQRLGVMPSFSRPSVSDDHPYLDALFKTLKYHPGAPSQPFASLEDARQWVAHFADWYNETHRHSAL